VIGTLERHDLIERNDSTPGGLTKFSEVIQQETNGRNPPGRKVGLGQVQQSPPVISSMQAEQIAPPPSWTPTDLGKQVLGFYEVTGIGNEIAPPQAEGQAG